MTYCTFQPDLNNTYKRSSGHEVFSPSRELEGMPLDTDIGSSQYGRYRNQINEEE